jgi:hypothetical protein
LYSIQRILSLSTNRDLALSDLPLSLLVFDTAIFSSCYFSLASTIGCLLIPGGRYTHIAWLRTASDTVSSLGTDP